MGLSKVRVHIKVSDSKMQNEIEQFIKELPSTITGDELEEVPEEFREMLSMTDTINPEQIVCKKGILSTDKMGFENFEDTGKEISAKYQTPVMAAFVFDSDVAAIQVFQDGQTVLEEMYSMDMKKSMDKECFIQMFGFTCKPEALEEAFAIENVVFAEEILQKAGEVIGIDLI